MVLPTLLQMDRGSILGDDSMDDEPEETATTKLQFCNINFTEQVLL